MADATHTPRFDDAIVQYLAHLYSDRKMRHACRAKDPEAVAQWQTAARPVLRRLIGLENIASSLGGHRATVELGDPENVGSCTRQRGVLISEPGFRIPFWLLKPRGPGPFPLALTPHGHDRIGMDTSAGVWQTEEHRRRIAAEDRDVALQAAERGFVAIAPAARGLSSAVIPDITGRHGKRDCRSQLIHSLLAGRTTIGERVWDMERLIDWAISLPEVDSDRILMMGNSGGGVVTLYAAACEPRVTVAIPSCSFCTFVGRNGLVHHCDCNAMPGIMQFGEFHDVAGLIAPRHLLIVNGREDPLFPLGEVDRAVEGVRAIYAAAGAPGRAAHRYGHAGHRFYKDLMWPFVESKIPEEPKASS